MSQNISPLEITIILVEMNFISNLFALDKHEYVASIPTPSFLVVFSTISVCEGGKETKLGVFVVCGNVKEITWAKWKIWKANCVKIHETRDKRSPDVLSWSGLRPRRRRVDISYNSTKGNFVICLSSTWPFRDHEYYHKLLCRIYGEIFCTAYI